MKNKSILNGWYISRKDMKSSKLAILLLAGLLTSNTADLYGQSIHLDVTNQNLKSVLNQLEEKSGYSFIYDSSILRQANLSIILREENMESALSKLASEANFDYSIVNKTVTLTKRKVQDKDLITVVGKVLIDDLDGNKPSNGSGVSIIAKAVNKSVSTNKAGEFKIEVPKNTAITISYLGYVSQTINADVLAKLGLVTLLKSNNSLDEIVVMAYGKREAKENQVGSAFTITAKDIENRPALRIDALLEGIVPGVEFQSQDGGTNSSPRSRFSTRIRGEASTTGGNTSNEPLWVLDGIPLYTGGPTNMTPGTKVSISPLTYLNMDDIESVTVLKDASATTIYGANGSNGVILITTKKGKGAARVNYTFRTGMDKRSNTNFRFLDGPQYYSVIKRMELENGLGNIDPTVNTYWPDYYYQTGRTNIHNVSVGGSTENSSYYISGSMYDEKSITIGNTTKRYSLNSNVSSDLSKLLTINTGIGGSYNFNDMFDAGNSFFVYSPLISPVGPNGEYIERDPNNNLLLNMPGLASQNDHRQNTVWVNGRLGITLNLTNDLKFINNNAIEFSSVNEDTYESMHNYKGKTNKGTAYRGQTQVTNLLSTNRLAYNKVLFNGNFDVMIGTEAKGENRSSVSAEGSGFPNDNIRELSFLSLDNRKGSASRAKTTELSYFGRAGYVYDKRYAIDFTYRKDGSSNFGKDVKWGTFSSVGGAWTVSNEKFWPENEVVNFLKFKASYGNNGNSRFSTSYAKGIYSYSEGNSYGGNAGAIMQRAGNEALKWESTNLFNTGVDIRLFNRLSIGAELYKNVTHDMIDNSYVTMLSGFRRVYQNAGKLQNTGFELAINSENISSGGFYWNTNFIFSLNRNKVLELVDGIDRVADNSVLREGYNSKSYYMVRWAGVDPSTGDPMWYDANGNITKQFDSNNRVILGNPTPNYYGGITNNFSYKNFNLSVFIKYNKGGLMFDRMGRSIGQDGLDILSGNQSINVLNAWYLPGYLSNEPRLSNVSNSSTMNSSRYLLDKTYLSLDNVALSYKLDENFTRRLKLSHVNLTAMASKIGLWTPYSGKKGSARAYENLAGFEYLKDTKYLYNTYAEMSDSNSRIANYSLSISIGF